MECHFASYICLDLSPMIHMTSIYLIAQSCLDIVFIALLQSMSLILCLMQHADVIILVYLLYLINLGVVGDIASTLVQKIETLKSSQAGLVEWSPLR